MPWTVEYTKQANTDLNVLDNSQKKQVLKAILKVAENPLPTTKGGYGKLLGNRSTSKLVGYLKIKLQKLGIRVIYRIVREKEVMRIVIISMRAEGQVYKLLQERIRKGTV
jgi:mRNA interferase RelE/StbE